jgi:hypothetical protein
MKGIILRVGLDTGCGGALGPIRDDGRFVYIPIPEDVSTSTIKTYSNTKDREGSFLAELVPNKTKEKSLHNDPDFKSMSYGEPSMPKLSQLLTLKKGDRLFFYAGLQPISIHDSHSRIYIIGFFEVEKVIYFSNLKVEDYKKHIKKYGNNAHFFRNEPDKELVVVLGNKKESRLLDKAVPLSDAGLNHPYTLPDLKGIGYSGSLLRAVGHKINEEGINILNDWIDQGPASLVDSSTSLFSYTMTSDSGFAPNPNNGYLTLACSKPVIRKVAKVGDWLLGLHSKNSKSKGICYLARISETLSLDEYYRDKRFINKHIIFDADGDAIYRLKGVNKYEQTVNRHHGLDRFLSDTSTDRVLICSLFYYFGSDGKDLGRHTNLFSLGLRGHQKITSEEDISSFVRSISSKFRNGIHSVPANISYINSLSKWC